MIFSDAGSQWTELAAGVFCGIMSGFCYELFSAAGRILRAGAVLWFILDFLFSLASIATLFAVLYAVNGMDFKWYVLLGVFVGFCLERASFAKPVATCVDKVYNMLKKAFAALRKRRGKDDGKAADIQG